MFPWEVLVPSNSRRGTGPLDTNGKAWKDVPDVGGQCSQDAQQEPKLLGKWDGLVFAKINRHGRGNCVSEQVKIPL